MADFLYGLVLGIVQGLAEFLPVSSSGHLELAKYIFGDKSLGEESLLLSVILHVGTMMSTVVVFRKEILEILRGIVHPANKEEKTFALKIILSMVPAAFVGLFFEKQLEVFFESKIQWVSFFLICTAALLYLAGKASRSNQPLSYTNAFIIGIAQAVAILPGISRSGSTIATSVLLGIDKKTAAQFSFLMVLPLIFGKVCKDVLDGAFTETTLSPTVAITGVITSFITGIFACTVMIELVKKSKLGFFAIYCLIIGSFGLVYFYFLKA
ncbi:MAG: undecaprenyl-diphosphate phosphatase [Saprospiraceae bacterium]|nr:undecaprenyl-diphosphate phosphatase [Saprospiraceae bacterium]